MERDSTSALIAGVIAGAAAMYYLDPRSGRRRRALLRDQAVHLARVVEGSAGSMVQDAANRARGTAARARQRLSSAPVDDARLIARVRARLGHLATGASAIEVSAAEGHVVLSGPVRSSEMGDVLTGIRRVPGVRDVESHLRAVEEPQRGGTVSRLSEKVLEQPLPPSGRGLLGLGGALLAAWGFSRGGTLGAGAAVAGALMVARAATNMETGQPAGAERHNIMVQKTLEVAAPVEEVFRFWSSFRNFPRFMRHLREVRESEGGISHWSADGPAGIPATWDAEITALQPHRRIAWRSLPGSLVHNAGEVRFEEVTPDRTRIHVRMAYSPPAGVVGQAVTTLFGADPRRQLDEDLRRFKMLLEEGSVTAHGRQVARQDVQPA